MTLLGTLPQNQPPETPPNPFTNSDLSFWGDRALAGHFGGFRVIDISNPQNIEDPANVLGEADCPGGQSDVSWWDSDGDGEADLVFTAVDAPRSSPDCTINNNATTASNPDSWEGVRVFDISDLQNIQQVAAVPTDCGAHTQTLIPDPNDPNIVYIYVSSYPLGAAAVTTSIPARPDVVVDGVQFDFPAGIRNNGTDCLEPEPGEAKSNGYHNKISIIKVNTAMPETADDRTPGPPGPGGDPTNWVYPNVKEVEIEGGVSMTHRFAGGRSFDFTACHDINAFTGVKIPGTDARGMAAGACWEEGIFWDISDPFNPDYVNSIENDEVRSLFHSATWTWDGKVVAFEDEAGGGGDDRCRDPEDTQGRMWFYSVKGGRLLGSFKIPRSIPKGDICTAHNYNYLPLTNGKYILASAWYMGGTSMIDATNPKNAKEVGYYNAREVTNNSGQPVCVPPAPPAPQVCKTNSWSSYWYNGYVYVNDITRGFEVIDFDSRLKRTAQTLPYFNSQTQEDVIAQRYRFASRLTLRYSGGAFKGRLFSDRAECRDGRNIKIKKRRRGPDRTVATATTDSTGRYAVPHRPLRKGTYYARASQKTFAEDVHTVVCAGARSNTIRRR
ncbi:MAG: hypothetical protein ACRDJV_04255 [Actinomycetota bacterium]